METPNWQPTSGSTIPNAREFLSWKMDDMIARGANYEAIHAIVLEINEELCEPKLPADELGKLIAEKLEIIQPPRSKGGAR